MHFFDYITPSNKFFLNVNLRDCWPIWEFLNALSYITGLKYINMEIIFKTVEFKYLNDIVAKSSLWHLWVTFHEKNNIVFIDYLCYITFSCFVVSNYSQTQLNQFLNISLNYYILLAFALKSSCPSMPSGFGWLLQQKGAVWYLNSLDTLFGLNGILFILNIMLETIMGVM